MQSACERVRLSVSCRSYIVPTTACGLLPSGDVLLCPSRSGGQWRLALRGCVVPPPIPGTVPGPQKQVGPAAPSALTQQWPQTERGPRRSGHQHL